MENDDEHEKSGDVTVQMSILGVAAEPAPKEQYRDVKIVTDRGTTEGRFYTAPGATKAVIMVGGVLGGWDTPGKGELYPRLAVSLEKEGVATLRIKYRNSMSIVESVLDVLAGIFFLQGEGIDSVGLVGHSFGGAVVLQAGAISPYVRTVVALSTQSMGSDAVVNFKKGTSVLFIHGVNDTVLPSVASQFAYALAHEPKDIMLLEGARHNLDESADEVHEASLSWLTYNLNNTSVIKE